MKRVLIASLLFASIALVVILIACSLFFVALDIPVLLERGKNAGLGLFFAGLMLIPIAVLFFVSKKLLATFKREKTSQPYSAKEIFLSSFVALLLTLLLVRFTPVSSLIML